MQVLIVNPNTSDGVTRRIEAAANAVAQPGDRFVARSAAFGPELIVTPEDGRIAACGVLAAVQAHTPVPDGIVLASFGDTGAAEVRAALPQVPVIGIAEAAFATVKARAVPFSIVTFAPEVAPPLQAKAIEHGLGDLLLEVAALPGPLACDPADLVDALQGPLTDLSLTCVAQGAQCLVMGGGPLAGLAARIAPLSSVPVIDGTQEAIVQLRQRLTARHQGAESSPA